MATRTPGEKRAEFIAKARKAVRQGQSQSAFLKQAVSEGFSFRRTDMISDWHAVAGTEKKDGLVRYVRKDYVPTQKVIADVPWKLSKEYMYKVKVRSRTEPGQPVKERMVNIMQDRPLSPREIESMAWEMIQAQSPTQVSNIEDITPWTVIRKVAE